MKIKENFYYESKIIREKGTVNLVSIYYKTIERRLSLLLCKLVHNASFLVTEVGDMEQERKEEKDLLLTLHLLHFWHPPHTTSANTAPESASAPLSLLFFSSVWQVENFASVS
jgi:hypothetical protein